MISLLELRKLADFEFNKAIAEALGWREFSFVWGNDYEESAWHGHTPAGHFLELPKFETDINASLDLVEDMDCKIETLPKTGKICVSLGWSENNNRNSKRGHTRKHDETAEVAYTAKAIAIAWYASKLYEELEDEQT